VTDANQSNTPNSANLPVFMRGKQRLSQEDIDDKKVGGYFTGLPIINFDMTKGFGFGARAYYYNNGPDNSPYFEYTPYRHALYLQGLATTGGWQYHKVDYDGLYIGNSPFRFRASAFYERNTEATYYGTGATAMGKLRWSGSNKSYSTMNALANDLQTIDENGVASTQYNRFDLLRPGMSASIERDFWEGRGRVLLGASVRHARIDTFDGKPIKGNNPVSGRDNVSAVQGSTLLSEDCASGKITGCNGGWDNLLRLAVSLDTRDFEPDPNRGVFIGVSSQLSTKAVGSTDTYGRVSMTLRGYYSPFPRLTDLVLAGRFAYQIQSKKTPFYSMSTLTFPEVDEEGLGGKRSLRGYQQNRFIGPVMSFANAEVRWMPIKFRTLKQHFGIGFVPFLDAGRVYDQVDFNFKKWRFGYGCGLRVAWNQATIVVADYGISREDAGFSLTFGHHF
jgi:outer membrane protein assembly factor BamA